MPNLGDYLGQLLSEITIARVQADMEAIRVAEIYSSHPLLRNFPVPRIRLPNIEMKIPVIISEVEEKKEGASLADKIDTNKLMASTEKVVTDELKKYNVSLNTREIGKLRKSLETKSKEIKSMRESAFSMGTIAKNISSETASTLESFKSVKEKMDKEAIAKVSKVTETKIRDELISKQSLPLRIKISPLTSQIKEVGASEYLVNINLSATEDAVEWTIIEEDGKEKSMLVPE
jgi:hypothetical protein